MFSERIYIYIYIYILYVHLMYMCIYIYIHTYTYITYLCIHICILSHLSLYIYIYIYDYISSVRRSSRTASDCDLEALSSCSTVAFIVFFGEQRTQCSVSVSRPNSHYMSPSAIAQVASIRHSSIRLRQHRGLYIISYHILLYDVILCYIVVLHIILLHISISLYIYIYT